MGPLLMIGLIVIPLVIGLVVFRGELYTWFVSSWTAVYEAEEISFER